MQFQTSFIFFPRVLLSCIKVELGAFAASWMKIFFLHQISYVINQYEINSGDYEKEILHTPMSLMKISVAIFQSERQFH